MSQLLKCPYCSRQYTKENSWYKEHIKRCSKGPKEETKIDISPRKKKTSKINCASITKTSLGNLHRTSNRSKMRLLLEKRNNTIYWLRGLSCGAYKVSCEWRTRFHR